MLWIVLAVVVITALVLKVGRRFTWSPAHLLRLEGYEWLDDALDWTVVNCDSTRLISLASESIQEQFKSRAPPGWTLKFEGPPKLPTAMDLVGSPPRAATVVGPPSVGPSSSTPEPGVAPAASARSTEVPEQKGPQIEVKDVSMAAKKWCPVTVQRVRTVSKSPREMILSVDLKLFGWLQEVFITSRHTNQLESSKCRLELIKLSGQVKVRLASAPTGSAIDVSACFSVPPTVNILIPSSSFKKEETLLAVERLLKESISNCGVRLSLPKNTGKSYADAEAKVVSSMYSSSSNSSNIITSSSSNNNNNNNDSNMRNYNNTNKSNTSPLNEQAPATVAPNRLKVKVLKANSLYDKGNHEAYCVVTVDSPLQTLKTSSVADSPNPFFDELLTFHMDETSRKVSFVIQDKNNTTDSIGRADLLLRDASSDGLTSRGVRLVLPLVSRQPTSHMSLTVELSSASDHSNQGSKNLPQLEIGKSGQQQQQLAASGGGGNKSSSPTLRGPSINVENLPPTSQQNSEQNFRRSLDQSQWRRNNSPTDSNLSLVSQASLMVRNNSNESEVSKGRPKGRSLMDAMKKRFRGNRSRSAEPPLTSSSSKPQPAAAVAVAAGDATVFSDGIYLTPPPPKRLPQSGNVEHWSTLSSSTLPPSGLPNKKRGKMSSFKNLFRKKDHNSPASVAPAAFQRI